MSAPPISELTDRARDIFRLVVEGYLESGQPVGSKTLAGDTGLNLSPASIRAVLADLESTGLLSAPHTSAGRMPTETGLRLFVDGMMRVSEPTAEERAAIEGRLNGNGPIEQALEQTSAILSDLSGAAGMVMVPTRDQKLAQFSLVDLGQGRALAVLVSEDGNVENRVIELGGTLGPGLLEQASNYINAKLAGRTLNEAGASILKEIAAGKSQLDEASKSLVERGLAVLSEDASQRPVLIVRGQANLLDDAAMQDIDRVRSLIEDLESKQSVAELLESAREAEATRIFIGSENRLFALSGSSVIASPYRDREGRVVGVLGVIGPTRLNYARVIPMIDLTARSLGKLIG
ncbi:heat-inducible transcriptional repressor HrcA [Altererythrobacter sp.]|uniref:heat-inducible transcriptional repressor HrcA n=1 Tax=Altererythrobacter sp. TaxID=1872480 RepID=UPI001B17C962|nr:heat-inducible transcriptional repressor HrcA [Altererythrobacter sp.]MBO6608351.1 heat-inducible transcriptional repressor HrcA [Altererythrobacter sp.]MBO6641392.1 heat-inducible transcriptional repressor HrcA [Altererythrobacter sp.]MBO6707910.1 heat-inducible transcriptional repressor HrcA [Altererythrobacter sp.]